MTGLWWFDLALNPVPFQRHAGIGARSYTPTRSAQFANDFRWSILASGGHRPRRPLTVPVSVGILLWRQHRGGVAGDVDNMAKAILDGGNGLLWADDRLVVALSAELVAHGAKVAGRIFLKLDALEAERSA